MRKIRKHILMVIGLLVCLLACSVAGASAAATGVQDLTSGDLAGAIASYKQSNPSALQQPITVGHKVVYAKSAYFNDIVNATGNSYPYYAKTGSDEIVDRLSQMGIAVQAGFDEGASANFEIQVGLLDRAEQQEYLASLDVGEFAVVVTQNRIMLLAWQDAALQTCVETFLAYLETGATALPVGFVGVGVANGAWMTDFPRPAGADIALSAGQCVNDDSLQFLYTGDGATRDAYLAYCTQLSAEGFSLVWQNTIGDNEFRMYQSTAKGMALYVAYNDYAYKAEYDALYQANYGTYDDTFAPDFQKCIRIISSPLSMISLPTQINAPQSYVKVTDTYMTTVGIASSQVGTCYVILLEDGRFVIIDGGQVSSKTSGVYPECQAIWDTMLKLYQKAYGSSAVPTAQRPLHVAAWYLTHAHSDHYNAFRYMADMIAADGAKKSVFQIDYVIANLPCEHSLFVNTSTKWGYDNNVNIHNLKSKIGNFQYLKVHTGQRIYFANLMIEVLMTFEDHLPARIYNTNDTNTVTRFHFKSSGAAKGSTVTSLSGNAVTVMFLGDSWRPASRFLCAMYGDYLKSDISQIAHHGNIGCEQELYATIAPTGVLFSNDKSAFKKYVWSITNSSNTESQNAYAVDKYVVLGTPMNGHTLQSVRYVWAAVAGTYATLSFTASGAQYDSAFDLMTGAVIAYVDLKAADTQQTGFAKHVHFSGSVWKSDATGHFEDCSCGLRRNDGAHADTDANCRCDVCGYIVDGSHQFGAWQSFSGKLHVRTCACTTVEYADHRWDDGTVTVPATHITLGVMRVSCIDCGAFGEESIPMLTDHEGGAWQTHTTLKHKRICICGKTEYAMHNWDEGELVKEPTHLSYGARMYTCTDCGATREARVAKLAEHEYGPCEVHNDAQHKRVCACGAVEYAMHTKDEAVVTKQPTQTESGIRARCCSGCGKLEEVSIPSLNAAGAQQGIAESTDALEGEAGGTVGAVVVIIAFVVLLGGGGVCVGLLFRGKRDI